MSNLPTQNISEVIESTKVLLGSVRQNLVRVAANLVILREKETRPWAEVCEDLDISQGFASKLTLSYQHYVIEGGIEPERLQNIDHERLYLARKTKGSPEEQLARAQTWSRDDFKEDKKDECKHPLPPITVCPDCWKQIQ